MRGKATALRGPRWLGSGVVVSPRGSRHGRDLLRGGALDPRPRPRLFAAVSSTINGARKRGCGPALCDRSITGSGAAARFGQYAADAGATSAKRRARWDCSSSARDNARLAEAFGNSRCSSVPWSTNGGALRVPPVLRRGSSARWSGLLGRRFGQALPPRNSKCRYRAKRLGLQTLRPPVEPVNPCDQLFPSPKRTAPPDHYGDTPDGPSRHTPHR